MILTTIVINPQDDINISNNSNSTSKSSSYFSTSGSYTGNSGGS